MKKLFSILLLIIPLSIHCQTDKDFIYNLSNYRNELIAGNFDNYKDLIKLDSLWKRDEAAAEKTSDLIFNILYAYDLGIEPKKIIKKINKKFPEYAYPYLLQEQKIEILAKNRQLIDLLTEGILKPDPPFQIDPEIWVIDELNYYEVKNGMRVAEIGAGRGMFSLMLGLAYDSLSIYVNEIWYGPLDYAEEKITSCNSTFPDTEYKFVYGIGKRTNIDSVKMDKIIIRNSFHHFGKKEKMLASIKTSMTPETDLYIYDPMLETGKDFGCNVALHSNKLKAILIDNGLKIIDEEENEDWGWIMLHCKLNE